MVTRFFCDPLQGLWGYIYIYIYIGFRVKGSWDIVTTHKWAKNPAHYNPGSKVGLTTACNHSYP